MLSTALSWGHMEIKGMGCTVVQWVERTIMLLTQV